jgi:hypothetical protein
VLNPILLNTANVLYVFCFGVRDVLWLRILAIAAMVLLLPFYANQIEPMISCMIWQLVFIAINAYWVVVIIRERLPPTMTPEEQELYDNVFVDCCSARDMLKLISHAKWNEADPGTKVIPAKTNLDELVLIHCGSVAFQIKEKEVINFHMGSLLGAVSFFTKEKTVADYTAATPVRYLSWRRDVLDGLFKSKPELKSAMYEIIGRDLVQKLIFQHKMVDTQHITMECI